MVPLPEEFLKDIPKYDPSLSATCAEQLEKATAALQAAKDAAIPDRSRQGPVFMVGEVLEIKGGRFEVTRIEPGHLRLKSLPK